MKTATTLSPNLALPSALRQALPAVHMGLILVLLAALSWMVQTPAVYAQERQTPAVTPSVVGPGATLDAASPDKAHDIFVCFCNGNWFNFSFAYQGSSTNATVTVTLTSLSGSPVQTFNNVNPGDVLNVTGVGGTVGSAAEVRVNGTLIATLGTHCTGSGATPLNASFTTSGQTVRVVKISGDNGGGGTVVCEIQGDLSCAAPNAPDIDFSNLTDAARTSNPPPGDIFEFTFPVKNSDTGLSAPAAVPGVEVTITYNATHWDFDSATGGNSQDGATAGTITFRVNNLARGATENLVFRLKRSTTALPPSTSSPVIAGVSLAGASDPDSSPDGPKVLPAEDDECATVLQLPVELTSFDALVDGRGATLRWQTASETNNAGFEIQHRYADVSDKAATAFEALDFVAGAGTTLEAQSYSFRADNLEPGRHVFRLKQLDYDGSFAYSPEVEVAVEMPEAFLVSAVYPNPFNPEASFSFGVRQGQQVTVTVFNMLGQQVLEVYRGRPSAGVTQTVRIDGSGLRSGTYVLRVLGERFVDTQTFTLIK